MNLIPLNETNLDFFIKLYTQKNDIKDTAIISRLAFIKNDLLSTNGNTFNFMEVFSSEHKFLDSSSLQKTVTSYFNNEFQNIGYDYESYLINYSKVNKSCKKSVINAYTYSLRNNLYYPQNDDCINNIACKTRIFTKSELITILNLLFQNKNPLKLVNGMHDFFANQRNIQIFKELTIDEQNNVINKFKIKTTNINDDKKDSVINNLDVQINTKQFIQSSTFAQHQIDLDLSLIAHHSEISLGQIRKYFVFLNKSFEVFLNNYKKNNKKNFLSITNTRQDTIGSNILTIRHSFNNLNNKDKIQQISEYIINQSIDLLLKDPLKLKAIVDDDNSCSQYITSLITYNELQPLLQKENSKVVTSNKKNKI